MTATAADHTAIDSNLALVIDDDAELRQFIAATLKQLGMRVAGFDMAKDALASLDSRPPRRHFSRRRAVAIRCD